MKPALLIIDLQKAFYETSPEVAKSLSSAVNNINQVIALFRKKNLPVICIQQIVEEENLVPGAEKFSVPDDLALLPSDIYIHKHYYNSFNKTPLSEKLLDLGVDTVITTGYCAEHCVLSTYRGARDHDLTSIILRGTLASGTQAHIKFVEEISDLITFGVLEKILE